eukprot:1056780-Prymnesium_polylepis.1
MRRGASTPSRRLATRRRLRRSPDARQRRTFWRRRGPGWTRREGGWPQWMGSSRVAAFRCRPSGPRPFRYVCARILSDLPSSESVAR